MRGTIIAALIGFASGVASGAFGIGGALLSTPGVRWALDTPALIAVGTTLPAIIPTAVTGVATYIKGGFVEKRSAVVAAVAGCLFAVLGALTTELIAGEYLLIATAVLLFVLSVRMLPKRGAAEPPPAIEPTVPVLLVIGAISGFVAGLLGVGGGVILVPVLTGLLRFPIKTALGTSLAIVAAQAIPGSVTHALLGNIDWAIAGGLVLGVIPGARIGSRLAVGTEDRKLRTIVAVAMMILAIVFGGTEIANAQTATAADRGPSLRRVAIVYQVSAPALFAPTGEPEKTADFNVDTLLQRLRAIETNHADTPMAITLNGVLCDELRLLETSRAKRAVAALRRITERHPVLRSTYTDQRADGITSRELVDEIERGMAAVEPCASTAPLEPYVPPALAVPTSDAVGTLHNEGIRSMLSAFAVPPSDDRPRVIPAALVGGDHELPLALTRPEAPGLAIVIEVEQLTYIDTVLDDETVDVVGIDKLRDVDVIGGLIAGEPDPPRAITSVLHDARENVDMMRSYTLPTNRLTRILGTVLARIPTADDDATARARALINAVDAQRRLIHLTEGSITFTSQRGAVPVTVANDAAYPVLLRIEVTSAKLDFVDFDGRTAARRVEIAPPGDSITFEAFARSSGTFPTDIVLRSGDGTVTLDRAQVTVRSVSANLSAVILTAGGALFLVGWFLRSRRRSHKSA